MQLRIDYNKPCPLPDYTWKEIQRALTIAVNEEIDTKEYQNLVKMILSPNEEDQLLATEVLRTYNSKFVA